MSDAVATQWLLSCYSDVVQWRTTCYCLPHGVRATHLLLTYELPITCSCVTYDLLGATPTSNHALLLRVTTCCDILGLTTTHYDLLQCTLPYRYALRPTVVIRWYPGTRTGYYDAPPLGTTDCFTNPHLLLSMTTCYYCLLWTLSTINLAGPVLRYCPEL